jgi:histidinol-phosphate/aromatic aminotransferase/cobyric acid decarboxylase-like protein
VSPTPVTFVSPTKPSSYGWEATNDEIALRYGMPVDRIARFDLNTSPAPPALVEKVLAAGRFEVPVSEYPPGDYRRLVRAAAARYGAGHPLAHCLRLTVRNQEQDDRLIDAARDLTSG